MEERASETENNPIGVGKRSSQERQAETHGDDADVLEAAVRERSLEVVLSQGERHSKDRRCRAGEEQKATPPRGRDRQNSGDSDEGVNSDFIDDPGQKGGNVTGSGRRSPGKKKMERHQADLEAESD